MGKGNRNRVIRAEAHRAANDAGKPMMAGKVARRSRKDLKELARKGKRIRFVTPPWRDTFDRHAEKKEVDE